MIMECAFVAAGGSGVELTEQCPADLRSEDVHEVLLGGLLHARDAPEALAQKTPPLLADTRQIIELTVPCALGAPPAMRGDAEAVGLVTAHLQEVQRRIAPPQPDRLLPLGDIA